jgi:hypothetical protein
MYSKCLFISLTNTESISLKIGLEEILSIEVFVEEYLMPGMRKELALSAVSLDRLRLATKMAKNSPVYVENKADCKQTTLELLKCFHSLQVGS